MPSSSTIKTYDGTGDPEDHLKTFTIAAKVERWAMPTWCHMFTATLLGFARLWFDELSSEIIYSFKDLRKKFLAHYLQQKRYTRDPVEMHHVKQKEGESMEAFMERFTSESLMFKGAPELMRIFEFMHGITHLGMIKRLNDNIPKMTPKEILAMEAGKGTFTNPPPMSGALESRNKNKSGQLAHLVKEIKQGGNKASTSKTVKKAEATPKDKGAAIFMVQSYGRNVHPRFVIHTPSQMNISFPPLNNMDIEDHPIVICAKIGGHDIHRMINPPTSIPGKVPIPSYSMDKLFGGRIQAFEEETWDLDVEIKKMKELKASYDVTTPQELRRNQVNERISQHPSYGVNDSLCLRRNQHRQGRMTYPSHHYGVTSMQGLCRKIAKRIQNREAGSLPSSTKTNPRGIAENVIVKIDEFIFPIDFVVLDMKEDQKIMIILRRSFLATAHAMIDVFNKKISFEVGNETITFDIEKSMKFSTPEDDICLSIDMVDEAVLDHKPNDFIRPTLFAASTSEAEAQLPKLKELPSHLEYSFLNNNQEFSVIISSLLTPQEKESLLKVLTKHKAALAWKVSNIKGISPSFYTHKILMEDDFKLVVQPQRRLNPKVQDVEGIVLGHKISKSGIEVDRAKIDVITKLPYPTNVKGDAKFIFSNECMQAFNVIKDKLTIAPVIVVPDWNIDFELMCDASGYDVGAFLGQRINKKFRLIYYASKTMNDAQEHYTTTEKELLAVIRKSRTGKLNEEAIRDSFPDEHLMAIHVREAENDP
ncbi:reverse transcriptase domain-containing protein [Tanacetum coccineum]